MRYFNKHFSKFCVLKILTAAVCHIFCSYLSVPVTSVPVTPSLMFVFIRIDQFYQQNDPPPPQINRFFFLALNKRRKLCKRNIPNFVNSFSLSTIKLIHEGSCFPNYI